MSTTTTTPNMGLIIPTPGQEPGPAYATDVGNSLSTVDQHNHTSGNGVAITPAGLNISTDLSFLSNNAISLRSTRFTPQSGPLSGGTDLGCLYENGVDLYYNDGNGNQIRLTQAGSIAGASGSISGLVSPASAVFSPISGTFTWQANTNVAAAMDNGPVTIRDTAASSQGITIASPVALSAAYTVTLLPSLPGSTSFLTVNNPGNLGAGISTVNGITAGNIAAGTITTTEISSTAGILGSQLATNAAFNGHPTITTGSGSFGLVGSLGENAVYALRGVIASNGTISTGAGFTSARNSVGNYTITYSIPFDNAPAVLVTGGTANSGLNYTICIVSSNSATSCTIETAQNSVRPGGAADTQFSFIAMGVRTP